MLRRFLNPHGFWKEIDQHDLLVRANAELEGSTVQTIPWLLKYFTLGIEYHNLHHLDPGVPGYKMEDTYNKIVKDGFLEDKRIGYGEMWDGLWNLYYNESAEKYESSFPSNL